ncbi:uncharacterized protein THITE_2125888 [Thermothielavioides terrestris NRRL 8126]|uniref:Uncharacterized protein n=1 Tax=Thermothielavioides terrestris (strain ATCC 38088 / NRRL 8126) TaxID=578455 RepID=G2QRL9_THETT|nr:uncharacterized protein THITE_2125888 [Thermothielavioides terrestris NRRL 8126]AEO63366.1 hypothetical protein THITE_2125888 [Thermothielavioides terrestris NRRL 8126]
MTDVPIGNWDQLEIPRLLHSTPSAKPAAGQGQSNKSLSKEGMVTISVSHPEAKGGRSGKFNEWNEAKKLEEPESKPTQGWVAVSSAESISSCGGRWGLPIKQRKSTAGGGENSTAVSPPHGHPSRIDIDEKRHGQRRANRASAQFSGRRGAGRLFAFHGEGTNKKLHL